MNNALADALVKMLLDKADEYKAKAAEAALKFVTFKAAEFEHLFHVAVSVEKELRNMEGRVRQCVRDAEEASGDGPLAWIPWDGSATSPRGLSIYDTVIVKLACGDTMEGLVGNFVWLHNVTLCEANIVSYQVKCRAKYDSDHSTWITWGGDKEFPSHLNRDAIVRIRFDNGSVRNGRSGDMVWLHALAHNNGYGRIVAYQIIQE